MSGDPTPEACFAAWAPDDALWSRWAKPVLFVGLDRWLGVQRDTTLEMAHFELLPAAREDRAVVVELEGADAVRIGLALAEKGWRPVPLFNATLGGMGTPVVDTRPIAGMLIEGAQRLPLTRIAPDAPPAFLIDADRMAGTPVPGRYDNRWVVLPQDFPSAVFLRSRGIREALLIRRRAGSVKDDLTHVLLRWLEGGIALCGLDLDHPDKAGDLTLSVPGAFRRAWYRVSALVGLHRNNIGGFGALLPEQTSSSGGFYG